MDQGAAPLVGFDEIAGVRVRYDRLADARYAYGTQGVRHTFQTDARFRDTLAACFDELWAVCPYGRAATIASAGAYVNRPGLHGLGRAFDLDAVFWPGKRVWRGIDFRTQPLVALGIESILRRHFGIVLGFLYDPAHRDHFHVDDGREPLFASDARSCVLFLQSVATHLAGRPVEPDGCWTQDLERTVLEAFDLRGDLRERGLWHTLLARTARAAFEADQASGAADAGRGLRVPPRRGLSRLKDHDPETTAFIERFSACRRASGRPAGVQMTWVRHSAIAPNIKLAVLHAEDGRFFRHRGIDWVELRRALTGAAIGRQPLRGASTITQQLVKNIWLTPERTIARKAREALLVGWLELAVHKARILELYLNLVQFGPGVFGVEAASAHYFRKASADLDVREAAKLAAALSRPSSWYPGCADPAYARRVAWIERTVLEQGPEALARDGLLRRGVRLILKRLRL